MRHLFRLLPLLVAINAGVAHAADWSDAYIGYAYGTKFKDPGSAADVKKHVVTLQYVGGYKYGVNFFTLDMLKSDINNPASGGQVTPVTITSSRGAQEVYVVYNNTLSFGKLSGKPVAFGPVRDVGFQAGFDFNSKNDTFGAGLIKLIAGPKLEFDVPGLLTLGLFYYKENNNNAIAPAIGAGSGNVNFDAAPRLATVWNFGFGAQASFAIFFVIGIVSFEPDDTTVAFEGQHVRRNAI